MRKTLYTFTLLCSLFVLVFSSSLPIQAQTVARRPFPQHQAYASGTIRPNHRTQTQLDNDVRLFYDRWKADFVRSAGVSATGQTLYRIAFGKAGSSNAQYTVSEGQGYGMVIVALMAGHDPQAQAIFDGLWEFAHAFPSQIEGRLMGWKWPIDQSGNAFDGDADIAYGLLLADKQWGSTGRINYAAAANQVIVGILAATVGPQSKLPTLGDWVSPNGQPHNQYTPRSSDFMPAHFRAYGRASGNPVWNEVVSRSQAVINSIQANYSPVTGLLPDFIIDANQSPRPAPAGFLEGAADGDYYYNAGRDPWRIGTDALLNNDITSLAQVRKMAGWIATATGNDATKIKAGYQLNGIALPDSDYLTTFFVAPFGVAAMSEARHQAFLNAIYNNVYNVHEDYFEDSVNLLCLLVMTGNYWDPTTTTPPPPPPATSLLLQAERHNGQQGVVTDSANIAYVDGGDWVKFNQINLAGNYNRLRIRYAKGNSTVTSVELRLDSPTGTKLGQISTKNTGGWNSYKEAIVAFAPAQGIHTIYFVFKGGGGVGNFDWFRLERVTATLSQTGVNDNGVNDNGVNDNAASDEGAFVADTPGEEFVGEDGAGATQEAEAEVLDQRVFLPLIES